MPQVEVSSAQKYKDKLAKAKQTLARIKESQNKV